MNSVVKHYH